MIPVEVAIIPPGALAQQYCEDRRIQMALAGELIHPNGGEPPNAHYLDFYNQAWKSHHVEWLLDNGAWEGERLNDYDLIRVAARYGATELVAPDVLGDPSATLVLTQQFLETLRGPMPFGGKVPRIAAVAHGQSLQESLEFVSELNHSDTSHHIKTISISRTTCYRSGNPTARFELALEIKKRYGTRYDIHLLGFSDQWPTELQHCASVSGLVRSMDTIAPFSYAHRGINIEEVGRVEVPRPDNYFDLTAEDFDQPFLIERNIKTLDQWGLTPIQRWNQ
jgi:hypothetical protein